MAILVRRQCFNNSDNLSLYHEDGSCKHISREETVYITEECPIEEDEQFSIDIDFDFCKSRDNERLVSGWASVSVNADGSLPLDWDDDIITPDTLEKAAINFMLDYRDSGAMHDGGSVGTVVESIVFTKDKQEALGIPEGAMPVGWFITVKVHDEEVYAKVKDHTYKMFSIQGKCTRAKL